MPVKPVVVEGMTHLGRLSIECSGRQLHREVFDPTLCPSLMLGSYNSNWALQRECFVAGASGQ